MVNVDGDSIAGAASEFGVGWHTANQAVAEYTDPHIDDPDRLEAVTAIGVDEKRFLNATVDHRTVYTTQIVDLDRHRLLDVIEGRSRNVLGNWLSQRGEQWCDRIRLATLDPAAGYRKALEEHLEGATLVVDHFHAIKLANTAIDDTRRRVQQQTLGHRGRKTDPLYRARRVLLTADERLSQDRFEWMATLLNVGDPDGEVSAAWVAKELLRDVYSAAGEAHARRRLVAFYIWCADAGVPEVARLARTVSRWSQQILAYHTTGRASNGRVENTHMLAEKIRRNAHGFTNINNYRRRLLGRLGIKWHTQPTARIRGRQPRFIA
jgi:transposase